MEAAQEAGLGPFLTDGRTAQAVECGTLKAIARAFGHQGE